MKQANKIRALADLLITTLGDMPSEEADKNVKAVAQSLYNDILKIEGEIQRGKNAGYICFTQLGGGVMDENKSIAIASDYKFKKKSN